MFVPFCRRPPLTNNNNNVVETIKKNFCILFNSESKTLSCASDSEKKFVSVKEEKNAELKMHKDDEVSSKAKKKREKKRKKSL
jgi:hypothetical protein